MKDSFTLTLFLLGSLCIPLCTVSLTGCSSEPTAGSNPESKRKEHPKQSTAKPDAGAMQRGRILVATSCTKCHRMYWPKEHTPAEWKVFARSMGRKASFSPRQIDESSLYLTTASRRSGR